MNLRVVPALLFAIVGWGACGGIGPQTPAARASDAARELNVTSRFGEVASVATMTSPAVREEFLSRRVEWGKAIRVVDVDLGGFTMKDQNHATVQVDFAWTRIDEGTLHNTRVLQEWSDSEGPWLLVREKRESGEVGLFGEPVATKDAEPHPDVQFATRVIP